jgi:prepilin-type N-terminal cleavage/methylation domain-containing protein
MPHIDIKKRKRAGFTLIEMMITALVMGVVISTIAYAFFDILRTSAVTRVKMQMQQDLRDTLGYMSRMMRYAGIRPVFTAIEQVSSTDIIFQCDYNADQIVDRLEFTYIPASKSITLTQWVRNGSSWNMVTNAQAVMNNITAMQMIFYTSNNQVTTNPALVTAGKITLTVEPPSNVPNTIRAMVGNISMSAKVYCPNLAWRLP